jgi:TonB family protein
MKLTVVAVILSALTACALQGTKPASSPVKISPAQAQQLLLKSADAVYPDGPDDLQGFVFMELRTDTEGNVADVRVKSGKPELAESAVVAFRQFKFKPYLVDGKPVECLIPATASFHGRAAGPILNFRPVETAPIRFQISQGVLDANKIHDEQPKYPPMARIAHIQGDVVLRVTISAKGDVEDLNVVSGHPLLIQAAIDGVRQWKYTPYLLKGKPVEVDTVITVKFHM